ncbi:MAG: hypothetical protein LUE17_06095 [Planctomycetaceae bacterium]|nr:hypothetical protein [Planctomycetaceae bacterium]
MALASPQGQVLAGFSAAFKTRWKIAVSGSSITRPNLFDEDGRGVFMRAVNGTSRQVGSIEKDQVQGHAHENEGGNILGCGGDWDSDFMGPRSGKGKTFWQARTIISDGTNGEPRTGSETRSLNIGMTPAIYLGV